MLRPFRFPALVMILALVAFGLGGAPLESAADVITFSGTVSYQGSHTGDSLFVAVLDTTGVEDVTLLAVGSYAVGAPPFDQPFSLDFDNSGAGASLLLASFLDVDGGGIEDVTEADVFGYYDGNLMPASIPSSTSQAGLDFSLPRAEIHGTLTLSPGQSEVRIDATSDPLCEMEGFRPQQRYSSSGPYSIVGLYPGTYCVYSEESSGSTRVCFGDPTCVSPTLVTLSETEVKTGVDLDFTAIVPVDPTTWGQVKSRYR
jgi:hypothetical protein